ncbi:hypothetical protein [uncultured phage cr4_1]|uniref:GIY-YIG domain-containing protein n=1 Tax=uncultured phage cr4_1 TaxID=2772084 RepID=A0A7M1RTP2_9CAUD|nr:homing endonuclease [uncultured phage cr4_1]QOR57172.1 hypothetical protein [uncultured phage cr4_1]
MTEFINTGSGLHDCCLIYKLTNLVNQKVYIGQTKNSLRKRIISHLTQARTNTKSKKHHLLFAILKYGYDNFDVTILEVCLQNQLNDREIFWISYYNSTNPDKGYNCTKGGDGNSVAREVKISTRNKISEANKLKWSNTEYREQQRLSRIESHKRRSKQIVLLTYGYELVKIWQYKKDICDNYNSQIYNLRKDRKTVISCGFIWMYLSDYDLLQLGEPLIVQLDNNYNIILKYYDYTTANIRIHELTGKCSRLLFDINQKFTRIKGTKKAGYIWMLYDSYKNQI